MQRVGLLQLCEVFVYSQKKEKLIIVVFGFLMPDTLLSYCNENLKKNKACNKVTEMGR